MPNTVSEALGLLESDPWRCEVGFTEDIESANRTLFDFNADSTALETTLSGWLQESQPCLFGRMAAKIGTLSYCILTAADLKSSDEVIKEKIQDARRSWWNEAYQGNKSGFVILAISEAIAFAKPDKNTLRLAQRLTQLYLNKEILPDTLYHEEAFIEKPGPERMMWRFLAGVNYFSAQGDRRWWQDHRIPGGMALSVNSVGHMVKSAIITKGMAAIDKTLGVESEEWNPTKIDSPQQALLFAVRTISKASSAVSGPATKLLPAILDDNGAPLTGCPFDMKEHSRTNCREYLGHYHTDITLPGEYFRDEIERPADIKINTLDFTYIYDNSIDNPDYFTMGIGERIRDGELTDSAVVPELKVMKMEPTLVPLSDYPELESIVSKPA